LALGRPGGAGTGSETTTTTGGEPPPARPTVQAELVLETGSFEASANVVHFRVPRAGKIAIELWSIAPNDLVDVRFGIGHIVWRPNVSEADYAAYLREQEEEREARARRVTVSAPPPRPEPTVAVADRAPQVDLVEQEHRRAIAAALEADRLRRRELFCAAHHEDRGCWGPGGYHLHAVLEHRRAERTAYCAQHVDDARCWSDGEWQTRRTAWRQRVAAALTPPAPPDGPPPAPLADSQPPKLSVHATWRPGYWQWAEARWVWLAGMWRVPDEDIASSQTTTAPSDPPPPQAEVAPLAPIRTAVWIAGFWQWDGTTWVWFSGSWQLAPAPRSTWTPPEWRPHGAVRILIPGRWVRP
ncbi:MAG: hypothetical protein NT062_00975, partial [Proteobacteria bacterium]|nr:hypothetical protein [Pseudomonadota bacterium]